VPKSNCKTSSNGSKKGVILFDAQDNIRVMNTRFEQIAGLAPEESGEFMNPGRIDWAPQK